MIDVYSFLILCAVSMRSYIELTNAIKDTYNVIAIDDNILMGSAGDHGDDETLNRSDSMSAFPFETINDVVDACVPHVIEIANEYGNKSADGHGIDILLGGWSYGGVIATLVTERLQKKKLDEPDGVNVNVTNVILFDAPLFGDIIHGSSNIFSNTETNEGTAVIQRQALAHFEYCTGLLGKFYKDESTIFNKLATNRITSEDFLQVLGTSNIIILRASEGEVENEDSCLGTPHQNDSLALYQQLTSTVLPGIIRSPGSHWTMLFGENVNHVARNMTENVL